MGAYQLSHITFVIGCLFYCLEAVQARTPRSSHSTPSPTPSPTPAPLTYNCNLTGYSLTYQGGSNESCFACRDEFACAWCQPLGGGSPYCFDNVQTTCSGTQYSYSNAVCSQYDLPYAFYLVATLVSILIPLCCLLGCAAVFFRIRARQALGLSTGGIMRFPGLGGGNVVIAGPGGNHHGGGAASPPPIIQYGQPPYAGQVHHQPQPQYPQQQQPPVYYANAYVQPQQQQQQQPYPAPGYGGQATPPPPGYYAAGVGAMPQQIPYAYGQYSGVPPPQQGGGHQHQPGSDDRPYYA